MQVNNETVLSRKYDEEYARFNYIMVGAAIGLLLIIVIVAKILCLCNKDTELEQMRLLAERRAAINRLENAPKEPGYLVRSKALMKIETASSMTTATNSTNSNRMPGQILSPELVHRQSVGGKPPNVQQIGWRWSSGQSAVGSLWAGSRSVLHLQSIIPNSASSAILEEEADEHEEHVTHPRSDHHHHHHHHQPHNQHQHYQTTALHHFTVRPPPIVKNVSRVESPIKENVTDFLQKIQTVI